MRMTISIAAGAGLLALARCTPNPGANLTEGGLGGAAVGCGIGAAATAPLLGIGCVPGAIIGGAVGGTAGLASTTPPPPVVASTVPPPPQYASPYPPLPAPQQSASPIRCRHRRSSLLCPIRRHRRRDRSNDDDRAGMRPAHGGPQLAAARCSDTAVPALVR